MQKEEWFWKKKRKTPRFVEKTIDVKEEMFKNPNELLANIEKGKM